MPIYNSTLLEKINEINSVIQESVSVLIANYYLLWGGVEETDELKSEGLKAIKATIT